MGLQGVWSFRTPFFLCLFATAHLAVSLHQNQQRYGSFYYNALAAQGDARAQYIMAASYYCAAEAQPLPVGITRVRTRAEADSLLDAAANQGYKPAIKTRECFRECRGEE